MEIDDLIVEYKEQAAICTQTDYADKKSVRQNNKAVDRMYAIVVAIDRNFGLDGIVKFQELLDIKENNLDLWTATHLLERLKVEKSIEEKALRIIETVAKGKGVEAIGYQYWLTKWHEKEKRPITSATRQARQQWFSVGIFPLSPNSLYVSAHIQPSFSTYFRILIGGEEPFAGRECFRSSVLDHSQIVKASDQVFWIIHRL